MPLTGWNGYQPCVILSSCECGLADAADNSVILLSSILL